MNQYISQIHSLSLKIQKMHVIYQKLGTEMHIIYQNIETQTQKTLKSL